MLFFEQSTVEKKSGIHRVNAPKRLSGQPLTAVGVLENCSLSKPLDGIIIASILYEARFTIPEKQFCDKMAQAEIIGGSFVSGKSI